MSGSGQDDAAERSRLEREVLATFGRIPRSRQGIAVAVVVVGFVGFWFGFVEVGLRGAGLMALGIGLLAGVFVAGGLLLRPRPIANALSQWHEFRMVRSLSLHGSPRGGCDVVLELVGEKPGQSVTVRCGGVGDLRTAQWGEESLWFSTLCAEELAAGQRDGMRFHLHDGDEGMISLRCRSIEVTPCSEANAAHT